MNIGKAAARSGISAKMIRYYESVGLLRSARRTAAGYRDYDDDDIAVLGFVQRARQLGFPVKDIAGLIALWQREGRASADVKAIAAHHIAAIDGKIDALQAMRRHLAELLRCCPGDSAPDCPIIADLAGARPSAPTASPSPPRPQSAARAG